MKTSIKTFVAAFAVFVTSYGAASAATCLDTTTDPDRDFSGYVTGDLSVTNSGCAVGTASNDSAAAVNGDSIFGGGWTFAEKWEFPGTAQEDLDVGLEIDGDTYDGRWKVVSTFFSMYDDLLLVFKGPNTSSPHIPDFYVAYLLTGADGTEGDYLDPFFKSGSPLEGDISHISAYVRGDGTPVVPVPASLPLLLGALGIGGIVLRRRQKA